MPFEIEELETRLREGVSHEFRLEPLGDQRLAVVTPFTFDDGDRFPIVLGDRWSLSDEGGVAMHLSYTDIPFDEGNRAKLFESIATRHQIDLVDGVLTMRMDEAPTADELLTFVHAIAQAADVEFLAREIVSSTFMEDLRALVRRRVQPGAYTFDYYDEARDPEKLYVSDVAIRANSHSLWVRDQQRHEGTQRDDHANDLRVVVPDAG